MHFQGTGPQTGCSDTSVQFKTDRQHCSHLLYFLYHIWHPGSSVVQGPLLLLRRTWSGVAEHHKQDGMFEPHGKPVDQPEVQLWQPRTSAHVTLCSLLKGRLGGHNVPWPGRRWAGQAAEAKLQRMASRLLHIFPPSCWLLCFEHVRWSRGGKFSSVKTFSNMSSSSSKTSSNMSVSSFETSSSSKTSTNISFLSSKTSSNMSSLSSKTSSKMSGGAGEGGAGAASCKESEENWGEEKKWVATCITLIPT